MNIQVSFKGIKHFKVKLGELTKFITLKLPTLTHEQAIEGKMFARNIAPYLSGALFNAIDIGTANRGTSYAIVSKVPKNKDGRYRPYQAWMHGIGKYNTAHKIKSGDPHYMFITANMLKEKYPKKIVNELRKTING